MVSKVLVIGDLHEPFCLDGYLEFCREKKKKYRPDRIVFIGDIIDNHYASFHSTDPNGMGGNDELELAIKRVARWYKAFPKATVCIGNHDRLAFRKAVEGDVPLAWIREYNDVLGTPNWEWVERVVIDDVQYVHGEGPKAHVRAQRDFQSTVQGHHHTVAYVQNFAGADKRLFASQVGCGIDRTAYAMAYAKNFQRPFISCAIIDAGELATVYPMRLERNAKS